MTIAELEAQFSKDPTLDACLPLTAAYLEAGRFLEAMVVCKKGVKLAPDDARGQVMLVRVFLEQGKNPKAQKELDNLKTKFGESAASLALEGKLRSEQGNKDAALQCWEKALQLDPKIPDVLAWASAAGLNLEAPNDATVVDTIQPETADTVVTAGAPHVAELQSDPAAFAHLPSADDTQPAAPAHVSEFFTTEALGFKEDSTSDIETAGPGRLTIVGFIPQRQGSLKTTLYVLGAALLATVVVAGALLWSYQRSEKEGERLETIAKALEPDRYADYRQVVQDAKTLLAEGPSPRAHAAMAFAQSVLAGEFSEPSMLAQARESYADAVALNDEQSKGLVLATGAVLGAAIAVDRPFYQNVIGALKEQTGQSVLNLTDVRLLREVWHMAFWNEPLSAQTRSLEIDLKRRSDVDGRASHLLAWVAFLKGDLDNALINIDRAVLNKPGHIRASLGQVIIASMSAQDFDDRRSKLKAALQKFSALPKEERPAYLEGLASLANGALLLREGKAAAGNGAINNLVAKTDDGWLLAVAGQILSLQGRYSAGLGALKKAITKQPKFGWMLEGMLTTLSEASKESSFKDTYRLLNENLLPKVSASLKARVALLNQDTQSAQAHLGVFDVDSDNSDAAMRILLSAKIARVEGKLKEGAKTIESFLARNPTNVRPRLAAELNHELSAIYFILKKTEQAAKYLEEAKAYQGAYAPAYYSYAKFLGFQGPEAKDACRRYLRLVKVGKKAAGCKQTQK